jgi:hypothetical protein
MAWMHLIYLSIGLFKMVEFLWLLCFDGAYVCAGTTQCIDILIYLLIGPMCIVHLFNASMCLITFHGVYSLDLCSGLVIAFVSI